MKQIVRIQTGSHLYGTATPQSDVDWTGVFLPATRDILLGRIPKTADSSPRDDTRKNLAGEEDSTWFSLHHFIRLAVQGQTGAIDMLFAPDDSLEPGPYFWIWEELQARRQEFLSKNMNAFVGYARGQAAKYSLKGERLDKLTLARDILMEALPGAVLMAFGDRLVAEGCVQDTRMNPQGIKEHQIGGKWFGESTTVANVLVSINNSIGRYGKRAQASREGVDWKAMSHALRVAWELLDIIERGEIIFPLPYAEDILAVKNRKVDLLTVQKALDESFFNIEDAMQNSTLPESVDSAKWDDWLASVLAKELKNEDFR